MISASRGLLPSLGCRQLLPVAVEHPGQHGERIPGPGPRGGGLDRDTPVVRKRASLLRNRRQRRGPWLVAADGADLRLSRVVPVNVTRHAMHGQAPAQPPARR